MSKLVRLGDIAEVVSGIGFPKNFQGLREGDIPVFKVGDISIAWKSGSKHLRKAEHYLSTTNARSLRGKPFPEGTTVFAKIGAALLLNRRALLGQPSIVDNNVMGLVPKAGQVIPDYLFYYMQTVDMGKVSRATTVPSVRKSDVVEFQIPLPGIEMQKEIVAEIEKQFSRLDEAVANLKRVKANLKRYKAAVLKAAVEGRLVEAEVELARKNNKKIVTGHDLIDSLLRDRASAWEGLGRYKEPNPPRISSNSNLPKGWAWASIEQLTPSDRPIAYGVLQPGDDLDAGVPFVRVGDIDNGHVSTDGLKRISPAIAAEYPRTQLEGGEVLVTLVGAIGRTALVPSSLKGANVARAVAVIPILNGIDSRWVELWLRSPRMFQNMNQAAHEVARKTLNLEDVRSMEVAIPPLAEQQRIIQEALRMLSVVERQEVVVEMMLRRTEKLRASVLANAFKQSPRSE